MPDLEQRLADLGAGAVPDPSESTVQADLRRSMAALRRRRVRRGATTATAALGVAAIASLAYVGTDNGPATTPDADRTAAGPSQVHPRPSHRPGTGGSSGRAHHVAPGGRGPVTVGRIRLVAYNGDQEPGFTVDRVPDGYVLQGSSAAVLDIAEAGDRSSLESFVNKLVITVDSAQEGAPLLHDGRPVTVNGQPGALRRAGDGTASLDYRDGDQVVDVQCWHNIALTDQQLIDFAEGITVTTHAEQSHG